MSGKGRRARAKVQGKGAAKALKNKGRPHLSTPRALALSESPPPSQNETCKQIRRNGSPRGVTHSIGAQASALSVK